VIRPGATERGNAKRLWREANHKLSHGEEARITKDIGETLLNQKGPTSTEGGVRKRVKENEKPDVTEASISQCVRGKDRVVGGGACG